MKRKIGSEFTGFEPLLHRGQIRVSKVSLFSGFTFCSKKHGFYVFIILLSFVSKSVCFALSMYVSLVLTFNYFVCD